jgi:hypothetical protein
MRQTGRVAHLEKPGEGRAVATEMVSAAFAAILALPAGPAAPVVAALAAPLMARMAERVAAEWRRKTCVVAETALSTAGIADPEAFCDALTSDPGMIALVQKILFAAAVTGNDRKLHALGAVLGRAAQGHRLDETNILIDALAALEEPHVIVMEVIASEAPENRPGWLSQHVQAKVALKPDLVLAVLSTLTRYGLAGSDRNVYGSVDQYMLTRFGHLVLDLMRQAANAEETAEQ